MGPDDIARVDRLRYSGLYALEHLLPRGPRAASLAARRSALCQRLANSLAPGAEQGQLRSVDVVDQIDPETFYTNYVRPGVPLVIKGAAADWRCCQDWTLDFFAERYAGYEVKIIDVPGLTENRSDADYQLITMADFVARLNAGDSPYLRFIPFSLDFPELESDIDLGWLRSMRRGGLREDLQFFVGGPGSRTPMHNAIADNFFIQVAGRKRWRLYPPRSLPFLDPPAARLPYYYSDVDAYAPDASRYPLFRFLDGYEVTLDPGDFLWNPPYVWHDVTNLTPTTIGIGYRFTVMSRAFRTSPLLTAMRFFAREPSVLQSALQALRKNHMLYSAVEKR